MTKKWKRIAALSSAVVMATATLLYFPSDTLQNISWKITASAESVGAVTWTKTESDGLTWTLYEDGTLTISGTGAMKDYDYSANQSPVYNNLKVKKVVIEDGVTSIGNWAFESCNNLISITIPDGVTSIGAYAFSNCWYLTNITIPNSVTSIENYAFRNCSSLTSITIPNSVTSIGSYAFSDCRSLTSITIPDSVTSIEDGTFSYCRSLTSITIPDSVTSIGKYAFYDCSNLTSITIPDSVTSIGYYAFRYCSSLTSITIPDSVTSIGDGAFKNCSSLKAISLSCKSSLKKSDFGDQADLVSASHTLKKTEVKAATCTENGNKEYWTCEHCKKYFLSNDTNPETAKAVEQAETVIPASHKLTHKLTKVEAKAATCTEDGNKEYWTCEHCGKYFLSDDTNPETAKAVELSEFIISASHELTKVEAKDATCAKDGNKEYWTCEHCGKYFLSDDTNPETAKAVELSETVISALKHKNATTRGAVKPTETAPGYSGDRYCPDCDTVLEKGYTYWNEGNLTWKLDTKGTLTISGTGAMKDYDVENNESPVSNNSNVKKIVIEDGVTSIGDCAFVGYTSLTSITIPDGVTSIGESAFYGCNSLTSITIPGSVTSIENGTFYNCSSLTDIVIPNSVTSIKTAAFFDCSSLTSITIPDSVTSIGYAAFNSCDSLTSITIPDSVTSIGGAAFNSCDSLTSITIPDSVTSIGDSVFSDCVNLKTIFLSCKSTLKRSDFGDQADLVSYTNQHLLTKTEAKAKTCTEGGNKEYWTCEHCGKYFLSDDTNPETAKAVELSEFIISASHKLTKVEAKAATCTEDGNKEYWTCEHCGKYFLSDDTNPETAKAVELSEFIISANHKLTKVEAKAATCTEDGNKEYWTCEHCGKYFLSDDTNPETAKAVELSEFIISASHKLTKVEAKAATCTEDGNKEYWTCEHCGKYFLSDDTNPETAKAVELSEFIISASHKLTKVEAKAATCAEDGNKEYWTCEHCGKYFLSDDTDPATAKAVELSETILPAIQHKNATIRGAVEPTETAPGYSGDRYCPDCDTVLEKGYTYWIEDNLTWKLYEDGTLNISGTGAMKNYTDYSSNQSPVFDNDTIKSVVIEDGVTSIGNSAFEGCGGLTSITIPDSVTSIGNFVFSGCVGLTNITIPNSVTCIGMKAFGGCSGLTSITIPNSVTSMGEGAFEFCSSLTSILLPDGITSIEVGAFVNCESLTDITIPDGVTSIGDWAFEDCSNLTSITIPSSVTNIGIRAFDGCSNLTSITIPDGVTSIGDWAFYHCNSLTNITIPGSVTNIGHSTFFGCKNLTSITILDGVTSIGMSVFSSCESLTDIIIPNSVTSIEEDAFSNCKSLTSITIPNSVTSIENFVFLGCSSLTDVTIPDSVTSIGTWAFKDCSSLTSITIPNSVTSIGEAVFDNCNNLTDIYYLDTKMKWKKISISEDAISPDVTIHFVEPATTVYGDVNLDGKVDILDAVFLNKYLATMVQFSDVQAANADCCQDDVLNEKDASALLQFVILLIDDLPVPPVQE